MTSPIFIIPSPRFLGILAKSFLATGFLTAIAGAFSSSYGSVFSLLGTSVEENLIQLRLYRY